MVFGSNANRIVDIVPRERWHARSSNHGAEQVLRDLARLADVRLTRVAVHHNEEGRLIIEVRCRDLVETIRIAATECAFPASVLLAYLNAKLADAGSSDRLVACRDATEHAIAFCDPDEQHELRACIFAVVDDLRWPSAIVDDTERGLLDAIRLSPDDDGPRLVYADWLTERGDRRGEFITLQCHPDHAVRERATPILATHAATWTGHLPYWATRPRLERGFVSSIQADPRLARVNRAVIDAMIPVPKVRHYDDADV